MVGQFVPAGGMWVQAVRAGAWQTWSVHVPFVPHAAHGAPFLPHAVLEVPGVHALLAQQPLGQDVPSQMHCP